MKKIEPPFPDQVPELMFIVRYSRGAPNRPVRELGLSSRAINVLSRLGISMTKDAEEFRPEDLLLLLKISRGVGAATLREIRDALDL